MDSVSKTLYIPLYGKAYVSKRGLFLNDAKAEEIWAAEGFALKGKSRSKWLAFYMGIRSAVFDGWVRERLADADDAVVLHLGCGMDSRVLRLGDLRCKWYDIDLPEVICQRRRYYEESPRRRMLAGDARDAAWLAEIPETGHAVVVMEGVSMYLTPAEMQALAARLCAHFQRVSLLTDCYTVLAAKMSRLKNPVNEVGVTCVHGIDDPLLLQTGELIFVKEHEMTPQAFIDQLHGAEKYIFRKLYAGGFSKKLYRLFEYRKG